MIPGDRQVTGHGCNGVVKSMRPCNCGTSRVTPEEVKRLPPTRTSNTSLDAANSSRGCTWYHDRPVIPSSTCTKASSRDVPSPESRPRKTPGITAQRWVRSALTSLTYQPSKKPLRSRAP